ncbi:MAG: hypothetical protein KC449_17630 [Anaerolineales bacterium]|nr:hypothetical protein [Anaerolineales bacterium]
MNSPSNTSAAGKRPIPAALFLMLLFGYLVLRDAWLSDDAYITFRTVNNFVNGYGLTWNTVERVQVYTHPLWMFLNSLFYALTHEIYLTSILLSTAVSLLTVFLLVTRLAERGATAVIALLLLSSSRAYIDYATSGLENPLTHLLLILFFIVYFRPATSFKTLFWLAFIAALAAFNRLDSILLFLPALLYKAWPLRGKRALLFLGAGFLPLLIWLGFATFYYGFPFPNTAYAKLNTSIPPKELFEQGVYYYVNSAWLDPITLMTIASSVILAVWHRQKDKIPLVLGMALYLFYILRIGGDFMSGRFFTGPLLLAVILIARHKMPSLANGRSQLLAMLIVLLGLSGIHPTLIPKPTNEAALRDKRGIADERAVYTPYTGLINISRSHDLPDFEPRIEGTQARHGEQRVFVKLSIGMFAFYAGPKIHVIDNYALADPLLARLPAVRRLNWRIGHFSRLIPEGYEATLASGQNQLTDQALARYYDQLSLITRGDLWDTNRLREIWHMNLGQNDYLIDYEAYRYPGMVHTPLTAVQTAKPAGTPLDSPGVLLFSPRGLEIQLETAVHPTQLQLSLDNNDDYQLVYFNDGVEVGQQLVPAPYTPDGLAVHEVAIPETAVAAGFNRVRIFPMRGDNLFGLGHFTFTP